MGREQISTSEATFLAFAILVPKVFLNLPSAAMEDGQTAAWLLIMIAGLTAVVGWALLMAFMGRFPGRSIPEAVEETLGPYLGLPVELTYVAFLVVIQVVAVRQFGEAVLTGILPTTPISVIMFALMGAAAYVSYMGIEGIARAARFFVPIIVVLLLAIASMNLLSDTSRPNMLFPLLGPGPVPLILRGVMRSSWYLDIILLPLINPSLKEPKKLPHIGYAAILLTTVAWVLAELVFSALFPFPGGIKQAFPLLSLARMVDIGRFFQRVEALFFFAWIFAATTKLSATLYAAIVAYSRAFHIRVYRPLVVPFTLMTASLSFLPDSLLQARALDAGLVHRYGFLPAFAMVILLLAVAALRGKGGEKGAKQKT